MFGLRSAGPGRTPGGSRGPVVNMGGRHECGVGYSENDRKGGKEAGENRNQPRRKRKREPPRFWTKRPSGEFQGFTLKRGEGRPPQGRAVDPLGGGMQSGRLRGRRVHATRRCRNDSAPGLAPQSRPDEAPGSMRIGRASGVIALQSRLAESRLSPMESVSLSLTRREPEAPLNAQGTLE